MVTQHLTRTDSPRVAAAAQHLYEAECALHTAHQSHVDAWITAASDRLHEAVVEHLAAQADAQRAESADQTSPSRSAATASCSHCSSSATTAAGYGSSPGNAATPPAATSTDKRGTSSPSR